MALEYDPQHFFGVLCSTNLVKFAGTTILPRSMLMLVPAFGAQLLYSLRVLDTSLSSLLLPFSLLIGRART